MTDDKKVDQIAQVGIDTLKLYPGLAATWRVTNAEDGPRRVLPLDRCSTIMLGRMADLDSGRMVTDHELVTAFDKVTHWLTDYPFSQRKLETKPVKDGKVVVGTIYTVSEVQDTLEQA